MALSDLPIADREVLTESEAKIGNKTKSYTQFGFGELVGLFNRSRPLERWSKHIDNNMGVIRSISLDYIVELRNKLTHNQSAMEAPVSREEAQLVHDCLFNWLGFLGYKDHLEDMMEAEGIDKFDVIFCALTLHHLKNPARLLMKLRRILRKGGALIIRGVDDGAMIAFDDEGLLKQILGQSNASGRFHGRKYYPWLRSVGFTNIKMNYQVDDTTQMDSEEREDFFHYYFDFRLQYTLTISAIAIK